METKLASKLLPSHLKPLETPHGSGIFSVTAFDFVDSEVGPYQEIVLSVIVPPLVKPGAKFPKSAFFPFLLGTSTPASREHAIERWHLPHYMQDISVDFHEDGGRLGIHVHEKERPILDIEVFEHKWEDVDDLYQSFMTKEPQHFKVDIHMKGDFSAHEEEKGRITLHEHPMTEMLDVEAIEAVPFRELWMKDGVQIFEELETLETV